MRNMQCNFTRTSLNAAAPIAGPGSHFAVKPAKKAKTKALVATAKAVTAVKIGPKKPFIALNAPKDNSITAACKEIAKIAKKAITDGTVTKLGHIAGCKGGIIDSVILEGKATTIESFISALRNSGIGAVKQDMQRFGPDTCDAVLAKRVVDHVSWCADTANFSHGGFNSRLMKVGLIGYQKQIAEHLQELAKQLDTVFKAQYSTLYKNRNKSVNR